jgi:hypothetical protein
MTTAQFIAKYTIPHLEQINSYSGRQANGLFMLKAGKQWYTTIKGWSFCLPRRFRRLLTTLTPKVELPVLTDERFIRWAEDHTYENSNDGPAWLRFEYDGDYGVTRDFLANLFGKPAFALCSDLMDSILGNYLHGQLGSGKQYDGKPSRDAFTMKSHGWQFADDFPGIRAENRTDMQQYLENKEAPTRYPEPSQIEGGKEFIDMLCDVASKMVVCPFVFPKIILGRRDGEVYFINTPDRIYFYIRRSI